MRFDAVAHGVFEERLQNQIRHQGIERLRRNVHLNLQSIAEARLLDLGVAFEEIDFFTQGDLLRVRALERMAQQVAKSHEHFICGFHVLVHERGDGVERVEKEMRVKLHLQRLQSRFGQPLFQFRRAQFAFVEFPIKIKCVTHADDDPIDEQVVEERGDQRAVEDSHESDSFRPAIEPELDHRTQCHPGHGKQRTGQEVRDQVPRAMRVTDGKSSRQPERWDGEQREHIPIAERAPQGERPRHRIAHLRARQIQLPGERDADERPERKGEQDFQPRSSREIWHRRISNGIGRIAQNEMTFAGLLLKKNSGRG